MAVALVAVVAVVLVVLVAVGVAPMVALAAVDVELVALVAPVAPVVDVGPVAVDVVPSMAVSKGRYLAFMEQHSGSFSMRGQPVPPKGSLAQGVFSRLRFLETLIVLSLPLGMLVRQFSL